MNGDYDGTLDYNEAVSNAQARRRARQGGTMRQAHTTHQTMTAVLGQWDQASGIRERLALFAELGFALDPHEWGYHASRDFWYYCGPDRIQTPSHHVTVKQEGSRSLELILERHHVDRRVALALIGYPEKG